MASRCEDGAVTGDFLDELPNFHIVTFSELEEHSGRFAEVSESDVEKFIKREEDANTLKKSCLLCWNFISTYIINRTLHGRLRIRILSSRADSISHSWEILSAREDKIRIHARPCNILYVLSVCWILTKQSNKP